MSSIKPESFFRTLPLSPDLEHLKDEAKSLKKRCVENDSAARAFIEFHQRASGIVNPVLQLADAQFAIARSYGFKSWPRLKAFVESHTLSPQLRGELLLKTLFTDNHTLLQELYERRATLTADDIFSCAALGNVQAVAELLASDTSRATVLGGPMQTQAITYAAFARFSPWDASYPARQRQIVELLLAQGADPNSFVSEQARGKDGDGRLSALYGCCRYPGNPEIAQLLLNAGASTDDGESLYHASELKDTRCLELLFAAGVPKQGQEFCIRRALDGERPKAVEIYLQHGTNPNHLDWALFRERGLDVIRLLVEYGADVNAVCEDHWLLKRIQGLTPVQIAERCGDRAAVDYLLKQGAIDNRTAKDNLLGACARADESAMRAVMTTNPKVMETMNNNDQSNLATLARAGRVRTVELMLDAGFNIEVRADDLDATALLYAATNGNAPMLRLLIKRGARLDVKHKYDGAPLGTLIYSAAHFRNPHGNYAEAAGVLIEAGEKVTDDHLQFAVANDLDDIADVLKLHGASM